MLRFAIALAAALLLASFAHAAPAINNVSLRGLQIGGTTTITLQGSELAGEVRLVAPFAIAKQEVAPGGNGQQIQLVITLASDVAPGIYAVRLATPTGITPPLVLGVDRLPQQPLVETIPALPVSMTGALGGGQIVKTSFAGKRDQPLVVDVEVQRLGANFKPVVRLYDSRGKQLTFSPPQHAIGGDARVALKLPADDTYTIELHDLLYRAAGPGYFRLKVGDLAFADFALPLAVPKSDKSDIHFTGTNLPPTATATVIKEFDFRADIPGGAPAAPLFTGGQPRVLLSDAAEIAEPPPGAGRALAAAPCGVSGVIAAAGEEDQYTVPVTAGQKLRIDVRARRLGSSLDGVLIVRGPQGNELARNDDQPGTPDPGLDFTVPAGVNQIVVGVRDMENRFSDEHVYHLSIRDAGAPDIAATIAQDTIQVPAGGTTLVPVTLTRTNYNGPVKLEVTSAVGKLRIDGAEIPAGANMALLTITAQGGAPAHSVARIVARATEPNVQLARLVMGPDTNGATRYQPWLRRDFGLAVVEAGPITVERKLVENPKTFRGTAIPLPLKLTRKAGAVGDVRVRLVTTQPMPKKKIKENNQDKEVDDVDRALRLVEGQPVFKPDQAEVAVNLQIPGDLPEQPWSYVLVAELLAADGKSVVAATATSGESLIPAAPLKLELTSAPQAEGRAGTGAAGNFTGKITREAGFNKPVTITLTGLPPEVKMVPQVVVEGAASDFTLPLTFQFGSKAGEFKGIKLSAIVAGDKVPAAVANVDVKIVPGEQPQ
jgi:hypothetical protein